MKSVAAIVCLVSVACTTQAAVREELSFDSQGVRLTGVLHVPAGRGRRPAIVLVHGSGRVTADAQIAGFANRLTGAGFAVYAYDKRGVGRSAGEYTNVGVSNSERMFDLLAGDALAAVDRLRARRDIDPARVGLMGVSQGGWIAPLAASRSRHVRFVVTVSGPAVSVGEEIAYSRLAGADPGSLQGLSDAEIEKRMKEFVGPHGYIPEPVLKKLTVPSFWILGDRDRSIPLGRTVAVLTSLKNVERRPITMHVVPGVDHGLRDPITGQQPDFWSALIGWLKSQLQPSSP
jgi:dipeptidyl aminopeptidase/acylaminoacyl peptidase